MKMKELIELIEKKLDEYMEITYPHKIFKSMKYTVLLPGKRLRPVMCIESARLFGASVEDAMPTACAIEMLHSQTLIHDDLPCMDNDDYRRGKLTNHKVFGEAMAVLAGDALLTFAPQTILKNSKHLGAEKLIKIMEEYFQAAGAYGVIAGQVMDIESEMLNEPSTYGEIVTESTETEDEDFEFKSELLKYIQIHKTSDLFKLALRTGGIIGGADDKSLAVLTEFGEKLGIAFQIADDILDETSTFEEMGKTLGKDKASGKLTYVSLYGLEKAKTDLAKLIDECFGILNENNFESEIFSEILNKIKRC
ncbi:TPA: polyprenyl synthetase family protein [Candidatus Scatenecus faecavium]|uniref:Polyprenyl synthetase family protein n=1 Tax=Candidatus Scatenecus faecavium TaxID=2840915 RepID=A0A9D1FVW2_9BACT|nr:polyprenyl synthetase family protein [Candidatus Scatenecus faecavium]